MDPPHSPWNISNFMFWLHFCSDWAYFFFMQWWNNDENNRMENRSTTAKFPYHNALVNFFSKPSSAQNHARCAREIPVKCRAFQTTWTRLPARLLSLGFFFPWSPQSLKFLVKTLQLGKTGRDSGPVQYQHNVPSFDGSGAEPVLERDSDMSQNTIRQALRV